MKDKEEKRYKIAIIILLIFLFVFIFAVTVFGPTLSKEEEKPQSKPQEEEVNSEIKQNLEEKKETLIQQVKTSYYSKALAKVKKAEKTFNENDLNKALELIKKISDKNKKEELTNRINLVKEVIDVIKLVDKLEKMVDNSKNKEDLLDALSFRDANEIERLISELKNESGKKLLQKRMDKLNKVLNDNEKPVIIANPEDKITNQDVLVQIFDENDYSVKVTLDGYEIDFKSLFTLEGNYEIYVIDKAFNENSLEFTIDKTKPVVTINGDEEIIIEAGDSYNEEYATATDNYDLTKTDVEPVKINYIIDEETKEEVTNVDTKRVGVYELIYTYSDQASNVSDEVKRTVIIKDETLPTAISSYDSKTIEVKTSGEFTDFPVVTGIDNAYGEVLVECIFNDVDVTTPGEYNLRYQLTDKNNNINYKDIKINVVEIHIETTDLDNLEYTSNIIDITAWLEDQNNNKVDGDVLVSLYKGNNISDENEISQIVDAGIYTVKCYFAGNEIFSEKTLIKTFEVSKRNVFVKFVPSQTDLNNDDKYQYDGIKKTYTAILVDKNNNKLKNLDIIYKYDGIINDYEVTDPSNVGTYIMEAIYENDDNNKLDEGTKTKKFIIEKADLTILMPTIDENYRGVIMPVVKNKDGVIMDVPVLVTYYKEGFIEGMYTTPKLSINEKGNYKVSATVVGVVNYSSAKVDAYYTVK